MGLKALETVCFNGNRICTWWFSSRRQCGVVGRGKQTSVMNASHVTHMYLLPPPPRAVFFRHELADTNMFITLANYL